ncbi:hypothetical protein F441_04111 [Phytophthora nicotianae CJ01A1]|nr:hypothetical protein L915_04020 [Phytophthora nicotianae]ETL46089.1 hypothetical protein L916_03966 [Phytophthora nicotianae]ETO81494.1 hypothetical protein F444_04208 [Phytophthora nicotianae P1976]ETP22633.1 hypothetical protein F441_04111 [Phytophthora nicotianae CJ01A1]
MEKIYGGERVLSNPARDAHEGELSGILRRRAQRRAP